MITRFLSGRIHRLADRAPSHWRIRLLRRQILLGKGTPLVLVKGHARCTGLPERVFDDDDTVTLDIGPACAGRFAASADALRFDGHFDDGTRRVSIPLDCVLAVYEARSGDGILFNDLREKHRNETGGGT